MENYYLKRTSKFPEISLNADTGSLSLIGNSIPENAYELFMPVLKWIEEYIKSPAPETLLTINLMYFNSSSTEYIVNILKKIELVKKTGNAIEVKWLYEQDDDDMEQVGRDFANIVDIPFSIIPI